MTAIRVREPESRRFQHLKVWQVTNFYFPGWVVFIPNHKNILLYLDNGSWQVIPDKISYTYAQAIGKKIIQLQENGTVKNSRRMA